MPETTIRNPLHLGRELMDREVVALDGPIGRVHDVYFDDGAWVVRYLVVDVGGWLTGRRVLLAPRAFTPLANEAAGLAAHLTRDQIRQSPDVDTDKPVSRHMEEEVRAFFGWPAYWASPDYRVLKPSSGDPHLRSLADVQGYHVAATDGTIGHVEDALLSDVSWTVHYLVVDTSNWIGGRRVLVAPDWLTDISWPTRQVHVALTRDAIENAPRYDATRPWLPADDVALRTHYRRYVDVEQDERGS